MLRAWRIETDDFDQVASAFIRWDHRFEQLGPGAFRGRVALADLGGVQLYDAELNREVRARGSRPPDCYTFTPVDLSNAGAVWRGRVLRPGMINVNLPGQEMDHRTTSAYRTTTLTLRRDLIERVTRVLFHRDPESLLNGDQPLAIGLDRLTAWVGRLRERLAGSNPRDSGKKPGDPGAGADEEIVAELVRMLANSQVSQPCRITSAQRLRIVREAEEHVLATSDRPLSILQLCELTGVSERSLHYAFEDVTGLSPHAYLKAIRLNRARRALLEGDHGWGSIHIVARKYGFERPGSFAADFQRQFGLLPSDLRRKKSFHEANQQRFLDPSLSGSADRNRQRGKPADAES
jgi:AraC family ethanolamine operon transcriptional activator